MFTAERWAAAFINTLEDGIAGGPPDKPGRPSGEDIRDRGLAALKALTGPAGLIPGEKSGSAVRKQLDRMIQRAFAQCGLAGKEWETARCFLLLTVQRDAFQHINLIIREIEKLLDKKKKILRVVVESAFPMGDGFWEQFKEPLKQKTGAVDIRFIVRTAPELLSGCRLQIGNESFDGSLQGRLQKMARDLALPPGGC
ncbi:MAG: F0F1 ATP synthase subunit delta [Treponema sp.]|jgi:F0F1-type ATP synthase delta subunit|nr:F0F1 ATP synthase subunit delta [Treponema sp.]